jgi:hypothetical protein
MTKAALHFSSSRYSKALELHTLVYYVFGVVFLEGRDSANILGAGRILRWQSRLIATGKTMSTDDQQAVFFVEMRVTRRVIANRESFQK